MKEYDVVNQVEINGKSICMESLTVEQRKQMVQKWQDQIMQPVGYIRRTCLLYTSDAADDR